MSTSQVERVIGEPLSVSTPRNVDGKTTEEWFFRLYDNEDAIPGISPYYTLYVMRFADGKLVEWEPAPRGPDYDIRVRTMKEEPPPAR